MGLPAAISLISGITRTTRVALVIYPVARASAAV